jgi:hypothetical protein
VIDFACLATKANGRLKVLDEASFKREWAAIGEGQEFEINFSESAHEPKHTRAQEKFFHGPVLKAFMSLGYTKEEAKAELCLRFIPMELHRQDGAIVTVPGATSKLGKKAYTDLIESCIQLAAELDIYIEDADEWRKKHQAA